jgi:plastocyanin
MKISNRRRRTYSLAVFCALTSIFLILNGCGDDDDGGGVPLKVTYSISGQTTLDNGSGLSGVTMALTGASSDNVITDASGNYAFTGLDNGSHIITPSRTGFSFSPTDNTQTVSGANISAVNFIATSVQLGPYSISGHVEDDVSHVGVPDVTIELSDARSAITTTDASGNYTFTGLNNGNYGIEPRKAGYTFGLGTGRVEIILSGANATVNFVAIFTAKIVSCPASVATTITIQDNSFTPDNVTISANEIVKWTNNGPSIHTVTAGFVDFPAGSFDSGDLGTGATFCVQFFRTGPHIYYCINHPAEMYGIVTVTGGDSGAGDWNY